MKFDFKENPNIPGEFGAHVLGRRVTIRFDADRGCNRFDRYTPWVLYCGGNSRFYGSFAIAMKEAPSVFRERIEEEYNNEQQYINKQMLLINAARERLLAAGALLAEFDAEVAKCDQV